MPLCWAGGELPAFRGANDIVTRVNAAIEAGSVSNRDGTVLSEPLGEALITDDEKLVYPVANGIPVLLEGESISLDQVE
jgi:uncharacterized protein YbaR (Trm112 family)